MSKCYGDRKGVIKSAGMGLDVRVWVWEEERRNAREDFTGKETFEMSL